MTDPAASPPSVVVVGYGLGGRVFHCPLITATTDLSLDAIVTSNPDRQRAAREAYPGIRIYESLDEAWAGGHDLAVVSTANVTHVPLASAALEHGMHVVLDKPVAPTAAAARALGLVADAHARLVIPFQNRRWDSDFLTTRRVAASGEIGRVHRFESHFERMRVVPKVGWRNSTDPDHMGGMTYDLGPHLVDQALQVMGPVSSVYAIARDVRVPDGIDDDVTLHLIHADGAVSHLTMSQIGAFPEPSKVLYGTRGGLRVSRLDSQEAALAAGRMPGPGWGVEPTASDAQLLTYDDASLPTDRMLPLEHGDWPAFYRGVAMAIRGEAAAPVLLSDAIETMRVLDAARESASTRSVIVLDPPAAHR